MVFPFNYIHVTCLFLVSLLTFRLVIIQIEKMFPFIIKCVHLRDPLKKQLNIQNHLDPPGFLFDHPKSDRPKKVDSASGHCKASRQGCRNTARVSWITSGFSDAQKWRIERFLRWEDWEETLVTTGNWCTVIVNYKGYSIQIANVSSLLYCTCYPGF